MSADISLDLKPEDIINYLDRFVYVDSDRTKDSYSRSYYSYTNVQYKIKTTSDFDIILYFDSTTDVLDLCKIDYSDLERRIEGTDEDEENNLDWNEYQEELLERLPSNLEGADEDELDMVNVTCRLDLYL